MTALAGAGAESRGAEVVTGISRAGPAPAANAIIGGASSAAVLGALAVGATTIGEAIFLVTSGTWVPALWGLVLSATSFEASVLAPAGVNVDGAGVEVVVAVVAGV